MKTTVIKRTLFFLVVSLALFFNSCQENTTPTPKKSETLQQFFDHMERVIPLINIVQFKNCELDSSGSCLTSIHPFFKTEFEKLDTNNAIHQDLEECRYPTDSLKILALEIRFHFYENGIYFERLDVRKIIYQMHDYRNGKPTQGFREILG